MILAEGQSDLKLLQQLEELRQVAPGETLGLGQELFDLRTLYDSFGGLKEAAALQGQLLQIKLTLLISASTETE